MATYRFYPKVTITLTAEAPDPGGSFRIYDNEETPLAVIEHLGNLHLYGVCIQHHGEMISLV